ncbi:MAG: penicillin-binding protein activator LpoB [Phycisphaeraceae bacterium]|nr:penicillin-binding protein activator LpoB [Phycisphaeraceae bacterium]
MITRTRCTLAIVLLAAGAMALPACGPTKREVERVDPATTKDLDYRFNDTDARLVWQGMVNDATFRGWIDRWKAEHGGNRPIMIVGPITNRSQDYIDTGLFTMNFEREMLNTGHVRVVSMRDQRGALRDERLQGQEWNSPETRKLMKNELGADLMLMGNIIDVVQRSLDNRQLTKYYQVGLELTNIETNEKVWMGNVEIKKVATLR